MDVVITYVNGLDPVWGKEYEKYTNTPILEKRFRDWGTLKYLLRGIETCMPFIRNVYLVVSGESQVPEWADTSNLDIVLHKDIIPAEFLPTFNSNTIEMHLHKIQDLDEEYIYFNDDMFPVGHFLPDDFFCNGKITMGFSHHLLASGMYKKICRNSDHLARKVFGMKPSCRFSRPQHICSPMLKSECEKLYGVAEPEIRQTLSVTRTENNLTQYLFLDYMYYNGTAIPRKLSKKHFSMAAATPRQISSFIQNPSRKLVCINDVNLSEEQYEKMRKAITEAFEKRFPSPSHFEKC